MKAGYFIVSKVNTLCFITRGLELLPSIPCQSSDNAFAICSKLKSISVLRTQYVPRCNCLWIWSYCNDTGVVKKKRITLPDKSPKCPCLNDATWQ